MEATPTPEGLGHCLLPLRCIVVRATVSDNAIINTLDGIFDAAANAIIAKSRFQVSDLEPRQTGTNRHAETNFATVVNKIGVSGAVGSSVAGSIVRMVEIFGSTWDSLWFLPVYDIISAACAPCHDMGLGNSEPFGVNVAVRKQVP